MMTQEEFESLELPPPANVALHTTRDMSRVSLDVASDFWKMPKEVQRTLAPLLFRYEVTADGEHFQTCWCLSEREAFEELKLLLLVGDGT